MQEEWRDIPGFSNYQASSTGRIRMFYRRRQRLSEPQIVSLYIPKNDRRYITVHVLKDSGTRRTTPVHRLVALAFLPNPGNLPTVNHIDGVKKNNCVENLEWASYAWNMKHSFVTGLRECPVKGENQPLGKLSEADVKQIIEERSNGASQCVLAKKYGVNQSTIHRIVSGKYWNCVGKERTNEKFSIKGERHPRRKLSADDVREIRRHLERSTKTIKQLAEDFSIATCTVSAIKTRRLWPDLDKEAS